MSKSYDKYRSQTAQSPLGKSYDKYRSAPIKQEESPSFLDRIGQLGKGALAGFSRGALEEAAGQAQAGIMEVGPGVYAPISTSSATANIPQKGIESLEAMKPSKNDSLGNILHHAGEFGGGVASFPMLPGRVAASTAKSLLPKFAKDVGTGTTIGGISGVLQNSGVNPLAADIGTTLALPLGMGGAQTAGRGVRNILHRFSPQAAQEGLNTEVGGITTKALHKLLGLGPKGLNIEAAQAARDLGVDLPAAVLTDSKLTGLADQYIKKAPYFGNKLDKKYFNTEEQIKNTLEDIYSKTGPAKTPEIEARIAKLYETRAKELPAEATILPKNTKQAIDNIKIDTAILSPDEKKLLDSLEILKNEIEPQSKLVSQYGPIKIPVQDFPVSKLVGTKKSLNQIIKWDMDEGIKNQLRKVQHSISQDIAEYGKTNPEWYKTFKEADKLYGDVAKREKLENLLGGKATNQATENLSYNALAKGINTPENLELIKKQVSPEIFEKIQKLGTVAKALALKNKNIPNPSGTAATTANVAAILNGLYNPVQGAATVLGYYGATKLLTDKKFLDLALKYAENPNKNTLNSVALNKRIKEVTGYSAVAIKNALEKQDNEATGER